MRLPSFAPVLLVLLSFAAACATATPYAPAVDGRGDGYSQQQIENNRFLVSFSGNSLTDRQTVETYLLYRAAELADANGAGWFEVVRRETDKDTELVPHSLGGPAYSGFLCDYRYFGPRGRLWSTSRSAFHDPWAGAFGGPTYREIVRFEASAEIRLGQGPKPTGASVFDAGEVLTNLGASIVRPQVR